LRSRADLRICWGRGETSSSSSGQAGTDRRYAVDWGKMRRLGGAEIDFDEALEATVRWYEANGDWWRAIKTARRDFKAFYEHYYKDRKVASVQGSTYEPSLRPSLDRDCRHATTNMTGLVPKGRGLRRLQTARTSSRRAEKRADAPPDRPPDNTNSLKKRR